MNTRRYGHRGGATPDYNLALLGEIGVGKSGKHSLLILYGWNPEKRTWHT